MFSLLVNIIQVFQLYFQTKYYIAVNLNVIDKLYIKCICNVLISDICN